MQQQSHKGNIYQIITDRICGLLEQGVIPWRKPWSGMSPTSYDSGKEYRGINILMLGAVAYKNGYKSPYWLTYNQALKHGGTVKRGEKATIIVWNEPAIKQEAKEDGTVVERKIWRLRYFNSFNWEQTESVPEKIPPHIDVPPEGDQILEACESVLSRMVNPPKQVLGQRAAYVPGDDTVILPDVKYFVSTSEYASTRFHEYGHSTGHESRLNRPGVMKTVRFGSGDYSFEELVAEFASAYLCAKTGIDSTRTLENSAAYIQSWLKKLRNDKTFLVRASGRARSATEYILTGRTQEASLGA